MGILILRRLRNGRDTGTHRPMAAALRDPLGRVPGTGGGGILGSGMLTEAHPTRFRLNCEPVSVSRLKKSVCKRHLRSLSLGKEALPVDPRGRGRLHARLGPQSRA
jgi:hypothetical protein